MSFSDSICQKYIEKCEKFDYRRTMILSSYGFIVSAPFAHLWYSKLQPKYFNKFLPSKFNFIKKLKGKYLKFSFIIIILIDQIDI